MTDHTPAWALIPWYGADGLGVPTLDDWRVWADWMRAHDPDDERDAAIARHLAVAGNPGAIAFALLHVHPWRIQGSRLLVKHRIDAGEFIGFEVQPTRREMRHTIVDEMAADLAQAAQVSVADSIRILRETAEAFADTGASARTFGRTLRNVSSAAPRGAPRNPRRRGDTGAHGRARR